MGPLSLSQLAVLAATVLAVAGTVPQLGRLWRSGDASGVSFSAATVGAMSELGWIYYTVDGRL